MNDEDLNSLKERACQAALAAGTVIEVVRQGVSAAAGTCSVDSPRGIADHIPFELKEGGSSRASQVVTEVDRRCQQAIIDILEPTLSQWDLALLSEELEDDGSRFSKDYFWAIDPLDGTLPFLEYEDGFAVSIALISRAGVPVIGVVYDPVADKLYEAIAGQGALCNKKPCVIPPAGNVRECLLVVDERTNVRLDQSDLRERLVGKLAEIGYSFRDHTSHYGAVSNAILAMTSPLACYLKLPKAEAGGGCIWDYGATACIYTEAGGRVSDCQGQPLLLNSPDSVYMNQRGVIFASTRELADLFLSVLANSDSL